MNNPPKPVPLEYASPAQPESPRHPRWMTAAIGGGACGLMLVSVLGAAAALEGPVFPLTVVIPHTWIVVESVQRGQPSIVLLGGALTGALYAALPFLPRRRWTIPAAVVIHVACFLAVCWMRDVWSLL